jgi:hypothetical protein
MAKRPKCQRCGTDQEVYWNRIRRCWQLCRPCNSLRGKEYRSRKRSEGIVVGSEWARWNGRKKLGVSKEEFLRLLGEQGSLCAICGAWIDESAHVDHDHESGTVRGLLCRACNVGLGQFGDDPKRLVLAAEYLLRPRG